MPHQRARCGQGWFRTGADPAPAGLGYAANLLAALLAVASHGWPALVSSMSDELFNRLKRWQAVR